jgi:hypothetical protein
MPKVKHCEIINPPDTREGMEVLQEAITKAFALAIYRSLSSDELNSLIKELKKGKGGTRNEQLTSI